MKNVNGMKNLKQMKNVKIILMLFVIFTISILSIEVEAKTEKEITTAKTVKVDNSVNEDLKLNIEQLRAKYSIKWFEDRYGKAEWVNRGWCDSDVDSTGIVDLPNGEKLQCTPQLFLNDFTDNQIKSIFVHFDNLAYNATSTVEWIYQDLYEKKEKSKWYHLKDFLYSKQVLFNLSKNKPKAALMPKYIPEDLPYYRGFLLNLEPYVFLDAISEKYKDDAEIVYKTVSNSKYSIQDSSPRLQKIYKEQGLEGLKKEAEKTKNNYDNSKNKGN